MPGGQSHTSKGGPFRVQYVILCAPPPYTGVLYVHSTVCARYTLVCCMCTRGAPRHTHVRHPAHPRDTTQHTHVRHPVTPT
eukprot:354024-Chlamydomonas_euryale.AAC.6